MQLLIPLIKRWTSQEAYRKRYTRKRRTIDREGMRGDRRLKVRRAHVGRIAQMPPHRACALSRKCDRMHKRCACHNSSMRFKKFQIDCNPSDWRVARAAIRTGSSMHYERSGQCCSKQNSWAANSCALRWLQSEREKRFRWCPQVVCYKCLHKGDVLITLTTVNSIVYQRQCDLRRFDRGTSRRYHQLIDRSDCEPN